MERHVPWLHAGWSIFAAPVGKVSPALGHIWTTGEMRTALIHFLFCCFSLLSAAAEVRPTSEHIYALGIGEEELYVSH